MDPRKAGPDADGTAVTALGTTPARSQPLTVMDGSQGNEADAQKKSLHAAEQDSETVRCARIDWLAGTSRIDPTQLIFLDESGVTTEMTRRYGRARRGERVGEGVPCGPWRTLTVLGAIAASGWVSTMTIESATDGDVFLAFLEQVLCPRLQPGNVVVMDNLPAHKVDGVRRLIEQRGARLHYLPAYSPDFNPIEMCWSKFKQLLRRARARSLATLQLAVADALTAVTPHDIRSCFRHCGYAL